MRPITPTLLAAAQGWAGRPLVSASVSDTRVRYAPLHTADPDSSLYVDQVCANGVIVRLRCAADGAVECARIADPSVAAEWTAWQTVASPATSGADPSSDVALAAHTPTQLSAYWVAGSAIRCAQSNDTGLTWSAPMDAITGLGGTIRIAGSGDVLAFQDTRLCLAHTVFGSGLWTSPAAASGIAFVQPTGIGICHDTAADDYPIIWAADGRVCTARARLDAGALSLSTPVTVTPGGDQPSPTDSAPADPACAVAGDVFLATYRRRNTGSPLSWDQPYACTSRDWEHLGNHLPLALAAATHRRAAVCYDATAHAAYVANERQVAVAEHDPGAAAAQLPPIVRYRRQWCAGREGSLGIECLDASGAWRLADDRSGPAARLQPLAQCVLSRGYVTSEGPEAIQCEPYFVLRAQRSEGLGGGRLSVRLTDGWGLFQLWCPQEPMAWQGRSIRWLLAELAARVGLGYEDDGSAGLARVMTRWTLAPGQSARRSVEALLLVAGAQGRFSPSGALYALAYPETSPEVANIGDLGEAAKAAYGLCAPPCTSVAAIGDDVAALGHNAAAAMALGIDLAATQRDHRITSSGGVEAARDLLLAQAEGAGRVEVVEVPCRPEIEPWDSVDVYADTGAIATTDRRRVVRGITEAYDVESQHYRSELALARA